MAFLPFIPVRLTVVKDDRRTSVGTTKDRGIASAIICQYVGKKTTEAVTQHTRITTREATHTSCRLENIDVRPGDSISDAELKTREFCPRKRQVSLYL